MNKLALYNDCLRFFLRSGIEVQARAGYPSPGNHAFFKLNEDKMVSLGEVRALIFDSAGELEEHVKTALFEYANDMAGIFAEQGRLFALSYKAYSNPPTPASIFVKPGRGDCPASYFSMKMSTDY